MFLLSMIVFLLLICVFIIVKCFVRIVGILFFEEFKIWLSFFLKKLVVIILNFFVFWGNVLFINFLR